MPVKPPPAQPYAVTLLAADRRAIDRVAHRHFWGDRLAALLEEVEDVSARDVPGTDLDWDADYAITFNLTEDQCRRLKAGVDADAGMPGASLYLVRKVERVIRRLPKPPAAKSPRKSARKAPGKAR